MCLWCDVCECALGCAHRKLFLSSSSSSPSTPASLVSLPSSDDSPLSDARSQSTSRIRVVILSCTPPLAIAFFTVAPTFLCFASLAGHEGVRNHGLDSVHQDVNSVRRAAKLHRKWRGPHGVRPRELRKLPPSVETPGVQSRAFHRPVMYFGKEIYNK